VPKLLRCARCRIAEYCSKECQKKHWEVHKYVCVEAVDTTGKGGKKDEERAAAAAAERARKEAAEKEAAAAAAGGGQAADCKQQ
jgi:hypothetical protein